MSTIKVGFNLHLNPRFDASVLEVLSKNPQGKTLMQLFKEDPGLINIVMPPSGKNGVPIHADYKPVLQAAGFNVSTYGDLIDEYKSRLYPDGRPKSTQSSKTANHSMFTSYKSSFSWNDGALYTSDMYPLALRYIKSFTKNSDGSHEKEIGNRLFLLNSGLVDHFLTEADEDQNVAYDNIEAYLDKHKDLYRFKVNMNVPTLQLIWLYDHLISSGSTRIGIIADVPPISYDTQTGAPSSMTMSNLIIVSDPFDFSTGSKVDADEIKTNHDAIEERLNKSSKISVLSSNNWKNVLSGATTMTKTQAKKAAARGAKAKLQELAEEDFNATAESNIKEINKPVFVAEIDLDDLDSSDS